ncbi:MAG TPA: oligosaccharide flippase family protein [Bacteroidia bacterium]|nr:oligosaccharide flippase family protein [Bacteroidia bacterium]
MISKSFIKSSLLFTLGGALPMLAGISLLPFYTNYLSANNYTQLLFYISISMLFQILFSFSIENYFGIRFTKLGDHPEEQKRFTGTVGVLLLLIGAMLLLFSALAGPLLFKSIYREDLGMSFWPCGFYSVLTGFFNAYFKAASVCLIYLKRPFTFLISNVVNFILTVGISVGGLFLYPDSILGPVYGRLFSGLAIFLIGLLVFRQNGRFVFDKSFLPELVSFCLPYLFYVLSGWVLMQVDRYILQAYIPNAELNAYDLVLKCFYGIEFIQNSLSAVIYPKVYEIWSRESTAGTTPESNRYFNVLSALNVLQLIVFCLLLPWVYRLFVHNSSFYAAESYIGILAAGYALRSIMSFYLAGILFTSKVMVLVRIFAYSAILQILMVWPASRYFGLEGAIYAGLFIKIIQVALCILIGPSVFRYQYNAYKILFLPLSYLLLNAGQYLITGQYSVLFYALELLVFGLIIYLIFRNEIRKVMQNFGLLAKISSE